MAEQMIYISKNAEHYSKGIIQMITDIAEEMMTGVKDGLAYKLANVENEEAKLHAFIKNEGYDITYKEFSDFIVDAKEIISLNSDLIESTLAEQIAEHSSEELSDDDLEQVSGGKLKWWQWLLVGVAAVAVVVACVLAAPIVASVGVTMGVAVGYSVGSCVASTLAVNGALGGVFFSAMVGGASVAQGIVAGAAIGAGVAVGAGTAAGVTAL